MVEIRGRSVALSPLAPFLPLTKGLFSHDDDFPMAAVAAWVVILPFLVAVLPIRPQ
jgi:hypothetical protein